MRGWSSRSATLAAILASSTACCVMFAAPPTFAQSDTDRATARSAATSGAKALEEGRYQEAIDLFRRAEAIIHAPPHLLSIARAQTKLGQLVAAHETYVKITRESVDPDAPHAFVQAHDDAAVELAALERRIPTLTITLDGLDTTRAQDEVTLTIDGAATPSAVIGLPRPLDPGRHVLRVTTANRTTDDVAVTLAEGTPQTVKLVLHPAGPAATPGGDAVHTEPAAPATEGGSRVPAYAALGVGALGVVLGTVFVAQNRSKRGDADALCPNDACPASKKADIAALDSDANSAATRAWIGYGVGVVGLGVGAVLLLTSRGRSSSSSTSSSPSRYLVQPSVGRGTFTLGASF